MEGIERARWALAEQTVSQPFLLLVTRFIHIESSGNVWIGQHAVLNGQAFAFRGGVVDGNIVAGDEILGAVLDDIPGWVAQDGVEAARLESLGERQVPGQGGGAGRQQRRLSQGNNVRPTTAGGDRTRQGLPLVVAIPLAQGHRAGPGNRKLPHRIQRRVQPSLGGILHELVADIAPNARVQCIDFRQRVAYRG